MEKKHIITIAGKPGSGKSTTANLVATTLGYRRFSSGDFMREMARERNMSLGELSALAEQDRSIDDAIDGKLREVGETDDNLVIDSRLAFHWMPFAFKVYLELDLQTAAHRIFSYQAEQRKTQGEDVSTFDTFCDSLITRFLSEQRRYEMLYGINPNEHSHFDLVIDTSTSAPDKVAETILEHYHAWLGESL